LHRLQDALLFLARFARDNRPILSRVLMDAASGNAVAAQFLRDNAPRHLALLLALMDEAERNGLVIKMPPMQRFAFVMGAVGMPILIAPALQSIGVAPKLLGAQLQVQVLGDEAIAQRIALVMKAIATGKGWT
jgi:hypothetical protein